MTSLLLLIFTGPGDPETDAFLKSIDPKDDQQTQDQQTQKKNFHFVCRQCSEE
jgi:hypothetical protein